MSVWYMFHGLNVSHISEILTELQQLRPDFPVNSPNHILYMTGNTSNLPQ